MKQGMVTLSVTQCKRLIAKGVAALPQVVNAYRNGTIIIAGGTTNGFVAEELTGTQVEKEKYTAGIICQGRCCVTAAKSRIQPFVLRRGKKIELSWEEALKEMGPGDVFIKGANALDLEDNIGILLGSPTGGTIGAAIGSLSARRIQLVAPVGLEKLVPSVIDSASHLGIGSFDYSRGLQCGMQVVTGATVVTEDRALAHLSGCQVKVAAKGGIGGSAGSTTLTFVGDEHSFRTAVTLVESVLEEKALSGTSRTCPCQNPCDFVSSSK